MTPTLRPVAAALALALSALAAPAAANDLATLKAQIEAIQKQNEELTRQLQELTQKMRQMDSDIGNVPKNFKVVTAGEEEGSFRLPGSDTSVKLYGFAQLDAYRDFRGRATGDHAADIGSQPLPGVGDPLSDTRRGKTNLTARTSRFGITTLTPTDLGMLRTRIEADFNKSPSPASNDADLNTTLITNSFNFRLRQAYGELDGDWGRLLAGQTWSTFMSLDALPETVDFNGHNSAAFIRQAMVRYTAKLGAAGELALAVENPASQADGGASGIQVAPNIDRRPDFTANWSKTYSRGFVSAQALSTEYRYDDGQGTKAKSGGWGAGLSGAFKVTDRDNLTLQLTTGKGLGRYLPTTSYHIASYDAAANRVDLYRANAWVASWQRAWTDRLRTNVAYGETRIRDQYDFDLGDGTFESRKLSEGFVNAIYLLTRGVEVGLEYSFGERVTNPGTLGTGLTPVTLSAKRSRLQGMFRYTF